MSGSALPRSEWTSVPFSAANLTGRSRRRAVAAGLAELLDREELVNEQVCRAIALQFAAAAIDTSDAVDLVNLAAWIMDGMDPWGDAVRYRPEEPEPEIRPAATDDELARSEHSRGLHRGDRMQPQCPVCVPAVL